MQKFRSGHESHAGQQVSCVYGGLANNLYELYATMDEDSTDLDFPGIQRLLD